MPEHIQQALAILQRLTTIKEIDPYLLQEVPAGVPLPDPRRLVSIMADCMFFYSEIEEERNSMFGSYIQAPLFKALQLIAGKSFDFSQTFMHTSSYHPLFYFAAHDTFQSPDAFEKLRVLFLKIAEIKAEEHRLNQLPKPAKHKGKLTSNHLQALNQDLKGMLADLTSPVNRFTHYLYDIKGLEDVARALREITGADPNTFAGRLNILRGVQVTGEIFKKFSPIVKGRVDKKTQSVLKKAFPF